MVAHKNCAQYRHQQPNGLQADGIDAAHGPVIGRRLYDMGLPPEMFQVITGLPADVGIEEMIKNEHIDLITFTGGVPT